MKYLPFITVFLLSGCGAGFGDHTRDQGVGSLYHCQTKEECVQIEWLAPHANWLLVPPDQEHLYWTLTKG